MTTTRECPALMISALASGQGKTTVTAALAAWHRRQGKRVTVFKTGPDYLDPLLLARASGGSAEPLDLWMMGEEACRRALYEAAAESDLILIEGAMGLFDGDPSSADLAEHFGLPVVTVIHARGMAQTVAAVALGLAHYRPSLNTLGIVANALGSERHRQLIDAALAPETPLLASLLREEDMALPSRHLGLVMPDEQHDVDERIALAADQLEGSTLSTLLPNVSFPAPAYDTTPATTLEGCRIAVARDAAFSFIYSANLRLLEALGADIAFFSPLTDSTLPEGYTAVWLPGGYPELHADTLACNTAMHQALRNAHDRGCPILAECGGMLYLMASLVTLEGDTFPMANVLPGQGRMQGRSGCQGMQSVELPEGTLRGHSHHHSRAFETLPPLTHCQRARHSAPGEAVYRQGNTTASYLHLYFPSNPSACAALFTAPRQTASSVRP